MNLPKKITWQLNKFYEEGVSEYCLKGSKTPKNSIFQIKVKYLDHYKRHYEIYLFSYKTVSIRYHLYLATHSQRYEFREMENKYHTLLCNEWQYVNKVTSQPGPLTSLTFSYDIQNNEKDLFSKRLGNNYKCLLEEGQFSDIITIKSIEGTEHKVHKALLANRSQVLKAHFEHNTIESNTDIVETKLENSVLVEILTFIYCNDAPSIDKMPVKLLVAADYYKLDELKSLCENKIKEIININNALSILQLAYTYTAEPLKLFTLKFIKDEIKNIMKTEEWKKMESSPILKDIIKFIVTDGIIKNIFPENDTPMLG